MPSQTATLLCLVGSVGGAIPVVVQQCSRCSSPTGCGGADRLHAPAELTGGVRMAAHLCAANSHTQDYKVQERRLMITAIVPNMWIVSSAACLWAGTEPLWLGLPPPGFPLPPSFPLLTRKSLGQ